MNYSSMNLFNPYENPYKNPYRNPLDNTKEEIRPKAIFQQAFQNLKSRNVHVKILEILLESFSDEEALSKFNEISKILLTKIDK